MSEVADSEESPGQCESGASAEAERPDTEQLEPIGSDPQALLRHGMALQRQGRTTEALKAFLTARRDAGAPLEATIEAAKICFGAGREDAALTWLTNAATNHPRRIEPNFWLGAMFMQRRRFPDAVDRFRAVLALEPNHADALKGLTLCLIELGRHREAEPFARSLRVLAPGDVLSHTLTSTIYAETGQPQEAVDAAETALRIEPNDLGALLQLAHGLTRLNRDEDAIAVLTRAKRVEPTLVTTNLRLATALKVSGHLDKAHEQLLEVLKLDPNEASAYCELAEIHDFRPGDPLIDAMERVSGNAKAPHEILRLHFALGKAYDDAGDPEAAFAHFHAANELERQSYPYDEAATLGRIDRAMDLFTPEFMQRMKGGGSTSTVPIFIVGIPRSGTTLIEQILASHFMVNAAGEADLFVPSVRDVLSIDTQPDATPNLANLVRSDLSRIGEEYVTRLSRHAHGRSHVTDKQLMNRRLLGLIHLALPNAKIIHCVRNPLDTCLSCYMKPFGGRVGYANDLAALGRHFRHTHRMMRHWHNVLPPASILTVRYEDVITDTEVQARRIAEFCHLPWDSNCLSFHETRRPVHTVSAAQVRKPIYRTAAGRWEAYARHLGPLITALGDLADGAVI